MPAQPVLVLLGLVPGLLGDLSQVLTGTRHPKVLSRSLVLARLDSRFLGNDERTRFF